MLSINICGLWCSDKIIIVAKWINGHSNLYRHVAALSLYSLQINLIRVTPIYILSQVFFHALLECCSLQYWVPFLLTKYAFKKCVYLYIWKRLRQELIYFRTRIEIWYEFISIYLFAYNFQNVLLNIENYFSPITMSLRHYTFS